MKSTPHVDEQVYGNILEVDLHGTLDRGDYTALVPETDELIRQYGKIRVLIVMHDFHGWDGGAFWEAIKWNAKHFRQVERLAVVGDDTVEVHNNAGAFDLSYQRKVRWQKWLTNFYRPFAHAEVRYFTATQLGEARQWLAAVAPRSQ